MSREKFEQTGRASITDKLDGILPGVKRLKKRLGSAIIDESGSATIESVLRLPIQAAIIGFVVDVSLTFVQMSMIWDICRDTTRRVTLGERDFEAAQAHAYAQLPVKEGAVVSVQPVGVDNVSISITADVGLEIFGGLDVFGLSTVTATYIMRMEVAYPKKDDINV